MSQPFMLRSSPSPSPTSPSLSPAPRCVSAASAISLPTSEPSTVGRESLDSNTTIDSSSSRRSSSTGASHDRNQRRGYVRPQGTNFAKSAQARESVLSLGSIAHLQYYFARTGLLDGKGGRLLMKRPGEKIKSPGLTPLETEFFADGDSMGFLGGRLEWHEHALVESPVHEEEEEEEEEELHPHMLPPTVSTYNHREKVVERPPTLAELKTELHKTLGDARRALEQVEQRQPEALEENGQGWHEIQGMHILDIITLAIRAAKMYYTAHDEPTRLAAIKSERKIRAELLGVMEVLKRMATRSFVGGMRTEERQTMELWVDGVYDMLTQEARMEEAERAQRASWTWLEDARWQGVPAAEREYAFMRSMDPDLATLPPLTSESASESAPASTEDDGLPASPLLRDLRTGVRLVRLHNAAVKTSRRPFGAISTYHTDTAKPYRCAENLRYWIKAAELRWEVELSVNVMGVVNGRDEAAWSGFEAAVWKWCARVREELARELHQAEAAAAVSSSSVSSIC